MFNFSIQKGNINVKNFDEIIIKLIFVNFSGFECYYHLDLNDTNVTNAIRGDDVKFLIHGYTDRVQFNRTG